MRRVKLEEKGKVKIGKEWLVRYEELSYKSS